jgi:ABC-type polar amino acid transport system ATPase subunit
MVFQSFNLWPHLTVLENVSLAPVVVLGRNRSEVENTARRVLQQVGMADKADVYPARLSGGQQQRVAIARALVVDPDLLLFDEPTSALDPELTGEVLAVMKNLAGQGRTMLVVTHELTFASQVADRILFMDRGRIVEDGPPQEILHNPRAARLQTFLSLIGEPRV